MGLPRARRADDAGTSLGRPCRRSSPPGIASGAVQPPWSTRDDLESERAVDPDGTTWYPLAGGAAEPRGHVHLEPTARCSSCAPTSRTCHPLGLAPGRADLGPYRITGELPTLPGPGRALSRPGGPFVLIRDIRLELVARPEAGRVERPHAIINRYAVERVASDIDLGHYFPGARPLTTPGSPLA
jgi:hypothetical protein